MKKKKRVIPGFSLSFGIVTAILGLGVVIPLCSLAVFSLKLSPSEFIETVTNPRVLASYRHILPYRKDGLEVCLQRTKYRLPTPESALQPRWFLSESRLSCEASSRFWKNWSRNTKKPPPCLALPVRRHFSR